MALQLLKAPGRSRADVLGWWDPSTHTSFAQVAPRDGVYYLAVYDMSLTFGKDVPQAYRFQYEIAPMGVDVVPPEVHLGGYSGRWRNQPLTVNLTASDGDSGSGVAGIEVSHDDGLTWVAGTSITVDAPADHSNDGAHLIRCRAIDVAGNVSDPVVQTVHIDTQGPVTQAWGPVDAVPRGRVARVRYRVEDLSPTVRVQFVIQSAATGRVVWRSPVWNRPSAAAVWWDPEYRFPTQIICDWPSGRYVVRVAGSTRDLAGNRWEAATCEREIVVK